jgi:hypothetical protein
MEEKWLAFFLGTKETKIRNKFLPEIGGIQEEEQRGRIPTILNLKYLS